MVIYSYLFSFVTCYANSLPQDKVFWKLYAVQLQCHVILRYPTFWIKWHIFVVQMVNNVCIYIYSMCVKLLTVLIKPRWIFYAEVTPLKINGWKRKCVIQGETRRYYKAEISMCAGLSIMLHQVGIVFHWQHLYSYISLLVWVNCSKHMCFLFKTLTLCTATEWV